MKKIITIMSLLTLVLLTSCSENYSNGERIGVITQFSQSGLVYKSWEGHLNVTQTGMNSSVPFDFSIDNDNQDDVVIKTIDSAAQYGWKVKLIYHQVAGYNWFSNRGETDHFVKDVQILEKNFTNPFSGNKSGDVTGHTIDTIYVIVIGQTSFTTNSIQNK